MTKSVNSNTKQDNNLVRLKAPKNFAGKWAFGRFGREPLSLDRTIEISKRDATNLLKAGWRNIGRAPELIVAPYMIEPMTKPEPAGHVPLCSVLLWIMTDAGATKRTLQDTIAWEAAVARLRPLISTGQIEVIGRPASAGKPERINGYVFDNVLVSEPLKDASCTASGNPWILSYPYNPEMWERGFNDQFFVRSTQAAWTHLKLKKSDVLREFVFQTENEPKPPAKAKATHPGEIISSGRGAIERAIKTAFYENFPAGISPGMSSFERDEKIRATVKRLAGRSPHKRTIQRVLKKLPS